MSVEYINGSPYEEYEPVDKRPVISKKINEVRHNKFHKDVDDFTNQNILKTMSKATKLLKEADKIETQLKIEYAKYKMSSYSSSFWQEKYIASFYLFVTVLGYLDKLIDSEKHIIKFYETFLYADTKENHENQDNIDHANSLIEKYYINREEILNEYKDILDMKDSHSEIVLQTLEKNPSYNKFELLYKDQKESSTQLFLNQQLISAYNLGYVSTGNSYDEVIDKYRQLYDEILIEKHYNDVKKVKKKVK